MPPPGPGMRASVTYLNLLAKVPMFRGMSNEQLQWVIDHSREWVVEPGAFGSFLGRLDLWVEDGKVVDKRWELIELTASRFPEDPMLN